MCCAFLLPPLLFSPPLPPPPRFTHQIGVDQNGSPFRPHSTFDALKPHGRVDQNEKSSFTVLRRHHTRTMNSATDQRRTRALLVGAIWLCFLAKAVFYSSFLPLWEGPDEYAHLAFVQYLASRHSLPSTKASVSREVAESLQLAPVPWTIRRPPLWVPHDDFWRLAPAAREEREKRLRAMPRAWATQPAQPQERLYESQQPPLTYLLFWLPYTAFEETEIATRVWILRIAGSVIASLAIPLGFLIGTRTLRSPWQAVGVAAVIASMPGLMLDITHVSNEPLAVFFGTACVLILISLPDRLHRPVPHALMLGMAFGCALLTKAYFLALVPAIAAIYAALWLRHRENTRPIVLHAVVTICSGTRRSPVGGTPETS